MAINGKRLVGGTQLAAVVGTLYTATNVKTQIQAMTLTNTSVGAVTATIHLVPSGASATDANKILSAKSLAAGESYKVVEAVGQWLEAGGTIQALASSATSISLVASGIEQS